MVNTDLTLSIFTSCIYLPLQIHEQLQLQFPHSILAIPINCASLTPSLASSNPLEYSVCIHECTSRVIFIETMCKELTLLHMYIYWFYHMYIFQFIKHVPIRNSFLQ